MCNLKSAIVLRDSVYCQLDHDHHTQMLEELGIKDDSLSPDFVRVEILPNDGDIFNHDLDNWKLKVDQDLIPDWFDKNKSEKEMKIKLVELFEKRFVINKEIEEITEGVWYLKNGIVQRMRGSSQVNVMRGSSQVKEMWGSSQVNVMRGSSQVNVMWESSQVKEMWGSSQVNVMRGSSQVKEMWGSSQVKEMWESSQVNVMRGSSQVKEMWESSQVNVMIGSSQVKEMWESSQVNVMIGSSIARSFQEFVPKIYIPKNSHKIVEKD